MNKSKLERLMKELEVLLVSQKTVFTVDDFCTYSGMAKPTIYKLTSGRLIDFSCPQGKLIFFEKSKIDQWLLKNPMLAIDDVNQTAINYAINPSARGAKS